MRTWVLVQEVRDVIHLAMDDQPAALLGHVALALIQSKSLLGGGSNLFQRHLGGNSGGSKGGGGNPKLTQN